MLSYVWKHLVILAATSLALVGCEDPSSNETPKEPIVIEFWDVTPGDHWKNYWASAIERFEKQNPHIRVEFEQVFMPHQNERLKAAFASGKAPDLFTTNSYSVAVAADRGMIADLTDTIGSWNDLDDFIPEAIETGNVEGTIYGVGFVVAPGILIYRKDFFAESGLDPELPPSNWEELAEYAVKLTRMEDGYVTRAGLNIEPNDVAFIMSFGRQNGGRTFLEDGMPDFDSEAWVETLTYFQDLVVNKEVNIVGMATDYQPQLYLQNKAAITNVYPGLLSPIMLRESGMGDVTGAFTMKRKVQSSWIAKLVMSVSTTSTHKEEALEFYRFVLSREEMWERYLSTGASVVRKSLLDEFVAHNPGLNSVIRDAMASGEGISPYDTRLFRADQIFATACEEIFYGGATPQEALTNAKEILLSQMRAVETKGITP
jgi:ABC-type glycerol-3-phosphate transport system substrate-binding protein